MSKTIVIIGSGFFGISAANRLANSGMDATIKLISPSNYTYFLVSSVRAVVKNETKGTIHELKKLLHKNVQLIIDQAVEINENYILLKENSMLHFDSLIIATGAKWTGPIGTTLEFKDDYLDHFKAQSELIRNAKDIVLIGGGFNNVELLGEIVHTYRNELKNGEKSVTLIHSGEFLLPNAAVYTKPLRKAITDYVTDQLPYVNVIMNKRGVVLEDGMTVQIGKDPKDTIKSDLVIQSTGVYPCVPKNKFDDFTNELGFIKVSDSFQTLKHPSIFAVGDVNDFSSYKGLAFRSNWLSTLCFNVKSVIEADDVRTVKLKTASKAEKNVPVLVSFGPMHGFGQFPFFWFGLFYPPSCLVVLVKSWDLVRYFGKFILANS